MMLARNHRRDGLIAAGLAGVSFALYAATAAPSVATIFDDSLEFQVVLPTLGIAHPSGYPLYVLLGKAWTLAFPVGSIAYRMSVLSAVTASATVALTFSLVRAIGLSRAAAAAAALTLAFSPSFWSQANVQRVYTLNAQLSGAAQGLGSDRSFARLWGRAMRFSSRALRVRDGSHSYPRSPARTPSRSSPGASTRWPTAWSA